MAQVVFVLGLLFWISISFVSASEVVKLALPDFSVDKIIDQKIGMSVSHKPALQLKSEVHYCNGKPVIIVHNYGQGEAGWTYAPGSAQISYENMLNAYKAIGKVPLPAAEKIAVIGSGINGILVAIQLAKFGYSVAVYADLFSPNTLSDIHAGLFIPCLNAERSDDEFMGRLEIISYKAYEAWANSKKSGDYRGITPIDLYVINDEGSFNLLVKEGLVVAPKIVKVSFGNSDREIATAIYRSFLLDIPLIMKEMMNKAKDLGVKFVDRKIKDLNDCMSLDANVIFNCTGIGSNGIFEDENNISFVGHSISIQNTAGVNYVMYANHLDGTYTYWLPSNSKMVIAGTFLSSNQEGLAEGVKGRRLFERAKRLLMNEDY